MIEQGPIADVDFKDIIESDAQVVIQRSPLREVYGQAGRSELTQAVLQPYLQASPVHRNNFVFLGTYNDVSQLLEYLPEHRAALMDNASLRALYALCPPDARQYGAAVYDLNGNVVALHDKVRVGDQVRWLGRCAGSGSQDDQFVVGQRYTVAYIYPSNLDLELQGPEPGITTRASSAEYLLLDTQGEV